MTAIAPDLHRRERRRKPRLMLSHGVSALLVSEILSHANPSITLSIYAHSTTDMQGPATSITHEILTPISVILSKSQDVWPKSEEEADGRTGELGVPL